VEISALLTEPPPGFDLERFLSGIYWHQGWTIFPGMRTPGRSPVEVAMDLAGVPADLSGKRVLDIGAWNGCSTFECERRGAAEAVALSLEGADAGFNQLATLLRSTRSRYVQGTIYDLDPSLLGKFDVVICFGVIYHLRYPVLGIDNLRRVAQGTLHLETHLLDNCVVMAEGNPPTSLADIDERLEKLSLLQFYPSKELYNDGSNWFSPSMSALVGLIATAGFRIENTAKQADRGYVKATTIPGLPPFLANTSVNTYEGAAYRDTGLEKLFGPIDQWR
jgi:tRNA (mo5U34)-methyltransferase